MMPRSTYLLHKENQQIVKSIKLSKKIMRTLKPIVESICDEHFGIDDLEQKIIEAQTKENNKGVYNAKAIKTCA